MPEFQSVEVTITGVTPMLMNAVSVDDLEREETDRGKTIILPPPVAAAKKVHLSSDGKFIVCPEVNMRNCIANGAGKGGWITKIGKKNTQTKNIILGMLDIQPAEIPIVGPDYRRAPFTKEKLARLEEKELPYEIDRRPGTLD